MSVVRDAVAAEPIPSGMRDTYLWHSQAHMPSVRRSKIVLTRGEGAYLWSEDGRRFLDTPASLWYCNVGHGRAEIAEAVAAQMRTLETYSTSSDTRRGLRSISPSASPISSRSRTLASS